MSTTSITLTRQTVEQMIPATFDKNKGFFSLVTVNWTEQMFYELPTITVELYIKNGTTDIKTPLFSRVIKTYNPNIKIKESWEHTRNVIDVPESCYLKLIPNFDNNAISARNSLIENGIEEGELWEASTTQFPIILSIGEEAGGTEQTIEGQPPISFISTTTSLIDWTLYGNSIQNGTPTPTSPKPVLGCGDYYETEPELKTLTGVPPFTINTDGTSIETWLLDGNSQQTGTPTPDNPIMPDFCGKLVGTDWTIPITCAGQTIPVYLGQTRTVRRIKKLVLTGEEEWTYITGGKHWMAVAGYLKSGLMCICSHYESVANGNGSSFVTNGQVGFYSTINDRIIFCDRSYTTTENWKSYLAAQYAAGTPVTVWYVLANEQTGIVNEPLMKIGDYADTLDSEQAGIILPTIKGTTTVTVDTNLLPSNMSITYYEQFQKYIIPITNRSNTQTIDLSAVQSNRKIKKLVLTGNEDWFYISGITSSGAYYRLKVGSLNSVVVNAEEKCTHYRRETISSSSTGIGFSMQNSSGYNGAFAAFRPYEISSENELATWKSYIAAQYANGTPVTVWYVLTEPETGIVNEPLMKIGTYSDSITKDQSGITIPVEKGLNTIEVETEVKPSNMEITYS